jgi:hypothetical protein
MEYLGMKDQGLLYHFRTIIIDLYKFCLKIEDQHMIKLNGFVGLNHGYPSNLIGV